VRRFWSKVGFTEGCWIWLAGRFSEGYGAFFFEGQNVGAHRMAYELLVGPIPEGMQLDHLCRSRACVNPQHLEIVTQLENIKRGVRQNAQRNKTHCTQGHLLIGDNVLKTAGRRTCRPCRREAQARWRARQ
jgi:hypothetical protein